MNLVAMERALALVAEERHRQDRKWGDQNYPNVDPTVLADGGIPTQWSMAQFYQIPSSMRAKYLCDRAAQEGRCTWAHILIEEVTEAIEAATIHDLRLLTDDQTRNALRDELIQVAAVAVQWAEKLDSEASR
ncbi:hypothetical protein SEA_FEYRE_55 [Mycobacterium phage Feyre]